MNLEHLPSRYEADLEKYPNLSVCRVAVQEKGRYQILTNAGMRSAQISGRFKFSAESASDYPAVGDYVMADLGNGNENRNDTAVIKAVLPRSSVFLRKAAGDTNSEQLIAANIDTLFICMALNNDFNLRRLERYLTAAWDSGASPVVLLTKADLCSDLEGKIAEIQEVAPGVDILSISALKEDGLDRISPYLTEGKTVAFVGSSGVGKSTLINCLLGEERMKTNGLRNDDKGRHTTTHRELIVLPQGATIIDTPGMREFGMFDANEGLSAAFSDIEELAQNCRFNNCTHRTEPGCAVRAAIEQGELSEKRLKSYEKLKAENAYSKDNARHLSAKAEKFKKIAKINKARSKKPAPFEE